MMSDGLQVACQFFMLYIITYNVESAEVLCTPQGTQCPRNATCQMIIHTDCMASGKTDGSAVKYGDVFPSLHVSTSPMTGSQTRAINLKMYTDVGHGWIAGIEVKLTSPSSGSCLSFTYHITQLMTESTPRPFGVFCGSLLPGLYIVTWTPLPQVRIRQRSLVYITSQRTDVWTSDLIITENPCNNSISVSFDPAPADADISYYLVTLTAYNSLSYDVSAKIRQTTDQNRKVVTLDIPSNITRPLRDRVIKLIPKGPSCANQHCPITQTEKFSMLSYNDDLCVEGSEDSPVIGLTGREVLILVVVCLLSVAVFISLLLLLLCYKWSGNNRQHDEGIVQSDSTANSSLLGGTNHEVVERGE